MTLGGLSIVLGNGNQNMNPVASFLVVVLLLVVDDGTVELSASCGPLASFVGAVLIADGSR